MKLTTEKRTDLVLELRACADSTAIKSLSDRLRNVAREVSRLDTVEPPDDPHEGFGAAVIGTVLAILGFIAVAVLCMLAESC